MIWGALYLGIFASICYAMRAELRNKRRLAPMLVFWIGVVSCVYLCMFALVWEWVSG